MERDAVQAYFRERLDPGFVVRSLKQTYPGMSRETWMVFGETPAAGPQDFVLRVDLPSGRGVVPRSLKLEWGVYQRLWPSPLPVAEPLWYDEGLPFAEGRAHMVRRMVEGSTTVPGVAEPGPAGDELRRRVALEHAEKLAQIHSLDWRAWGLDEILPLPPSPAEALSHELQLWKGIWLEQRPGPSPAMLEVLYWLESEVPRDCARACLIKGNNGIGEEIWRDARIAALSDWELAAVGDPSEDWAFSQGMLALWDPAEVFAHYERVAGFPLSPRAMAFSRLFIAFKAYVCMTSTLRAVAAGRDLRPVTPALALSALARESQLVSVLGMDVEAAAAALMGGGESRQSSYAGRLRAE